ncbi:MAG: nucleoside kinase [Candidatus Sumerlaeia bacterium]|nr:nucleoside kinase [Candidatus Sumerlaeia bacterium]
MKTVKAKRRSKVQIAVENKQECLVEKGTTVGRVAEMLGRAIGLDVCAAFLDNRIVDLHTRIDQTGRLNFIGLGSRDGNRMYQRSLCFVLLAAVRDVYPDLKLVIHHSLCKGLYCELRADRYRQVEHVTLTQADLDKIERRMREIIAADLPFVREEVSLDEARRIFQKMDHPEKAALLRYRKDTRISLYQCGRHREHFCGYLLPRTGLVQHFELKLYPPGFILRHPEPSRPDQVPPFEDNPKLFRVFLEYGQWCEILGLDTVSGLNEVVAAGGISEFIKIAEALHEKKIAQIADMIKESPTHPQVILVAGPSASGKTTSAKRLAIQLRVNGYRPLLISLDDYFFDRSKTPRDETGQLDFEVLEAIDVDLFNQQLRQLLSGKTVVLPRYSFHTGKRGRGRAVSIRPGDLIIVEGIHAFNRSLTNAIPEGLKFKVYISALTQLNLDSLNRVSTSDTRLIRRIVRDCHSRGYDAAETLARWPSVRRGEERGIFPYQEDADAIFNSALVYEYSALKPYAEKALRTVNRKSEVFSEASRLLYLLSYFLPIESRDIPPSSILREFIGGSIFAG